VSGVQAREMEIAAVDDVVWLGARPMGIQLSHFRVCKKIARGTPVCTEYRVRQGAMR